MIEFEFGTGDNKVLIERNDETGDKHLAVTQAGALSKFQISNGFGHVMDSEQINKFVSSVIGDNLIVYRYSTLPETTQVNVEGNVKNVKELTKDDLVKLQHDVASKISAIYQYQARMKSVESVHLEDLKKALSRTKINVSEDMLDTVARELYDNGIRALSVHNKDEESDNGN